MADETPTPTHISTATPPLVISDGNLALAYEMPLSVEPVAYTSEAPRARLHFWMVRHIGAMSVDNTNVIGMNYAALPPEVSIVEWKQGVGEIEYYDRPRLREHFVDVTPYCPFFQQFMAKLVGITLTQAKKIQCDLIDVLFESKRQMPFAYTVAAGAFTWDATDGAIAHMTAVTIPAITGSVGGSENSLVNQINNQHTSMVSDINTNVVGGVNSSVVGGVNNALIGEINSDVVNQGNNGFASINACFGYVNNPGGIVDLLNSLRAHYDNQLIGDWGAGTNTINAKLGTGTVGTDVAATPGLAYNGIAKAEIIFAGVGTNPHTFGTITTALSTISTIPTHPISSGAGPGAATIQFAPIEGVAPVNLTVAEMGSILSGIEARRNSLMTTQRTKRNAVNALTTLASVIAYDVTAGWPA